MSTPLPALPVSGTLRHDNDGILLVLDQHIDGHDTFLSGRLALDNEPIPPFPVRILSFDDVTVLRLTQPVPVPIPDSWSGTLHLPHGTRLRGIPDDLAAAAASAGRTVTALDPAERRYALTYLGEATTTQIRAARIAVIVSALVPRNPEEVPPAVISLDIGGTLGNATRPGLAARLAAASPLGPKQARRIMRDVLHTEPALTETVIDQVCQALRIDAGDFPQDPGPAAPLTLFPGTGRALQALSGIATLVTLSNVTCQDLDPERTQALLAPWIAEHFPSCLTGYAKPDPRAFHTVAEARGVPPARIVHVGDDWECDVLGATAAGLRAVWISHGRPIPDPTMLVEHRVRVAYEIADAVRHVQHHLDGVSP
jgi:FMN phosphatase YigB (HAD superfamily)